MTPRQRLQRRRNWLKRQRGRTTRNRFPSYVPNTMLKRSHLTMHELAQKIRGELRGWHHGKPGEALYTARMRKACWMGFR